MADGGGTTVTDDPTTYGTAPTGLPPGRWAPPPTRTMSPSALRYERWVRQRCGGPAGAEFAVPHPDGKEIWFDAAGWRGGRAVLVEAKARYGGFVDPAADDWLPWFRWSARSGLGGLVAQARRQVEAARGTAVEWWCAEDVVAELLADEFRASPLLSGRVAAMFVPMPGWTPD